MNQKLLSIAIPTWNRASTLEQALLRILPQVKFWQDTIQLVISDNASTDNSRAVVQDFIGKYPEVEIDYFVQETNTGFFGNFCKVKELSTAKYIWMLSDDDYIDEHLIGRIIKTVSAQNDIGLVFLHDWTFKNKREMRLETTTIDEILIAHNYRLTLISAVIFVNSKQEDHYIKTRFKDSNFVGFAFLISELKNQSKGVVLYGNSLNIGMDVTRGFNWFQAFIIDINAILLYMMEVSYNKKIVSEIKHNIFKRVVLVQYCSLKAYSNLGAGLDTWNIKKVNELIFNYYKNDFSAMLSFVPNYLIPGFFFQFYFFIKQQLRAIIWNKIKMLSAK